MCFYLGSRPSSNGNEMFMHCGVILIVRIFTLLTTTTATTTTSTTTTPPSPTRPVAIMLAAFFARSPASVRVGRAKHRHGVTLSQLARSGCLTHPVSGAARSPLGTRPKVRWWAEPPSLRLEAPANERRASTTRTPQPMGRPPRVA